METLHTCKENRIQVSLKNAGHLAHLSYDMPSFWPNSHLLTSVYLVSFCASETLVREQLAERRGREGYKYDQVVTV